MLPWISDRIALNGAMLRTHDADGSTIGVAINSIAYSLNTVPSLNAAASRQILPAATTAFFSIR